MDGEFWITDFDCVNTTIRDYRLDGDKLIIDCMIGISDSKLVFSGVRGFVPDDRMIGGRITWVKRAVLGDGYTRFSFRLSECGLYDFSVIAKEKEYIE